METIDGLWAYCQDNNRAIPRDWNRLYKMLANTRQKPSGGWEPSLPLILATWNTTLPIQKIMRFREHIEWANEQGQLDEIGAYLRKLSDAEWFHFEELPS